MTTQGTKAVARSTDRTRNGSTLILAAIGFMLLYFAADFVAPNLASSALPMPNAPIAEARAWFAENQLAAAMLGAVQFLSVSALAVFVVKLRTHLATSPLQAAGVSRSTPWGLAAVALMMLSSVLMWLLGALAAGASPDVVSVLRTANFVAGGTAHVLALGVFVILTSRLPGTSKPIRVLGYIAAVPAVLSVISLVWFQGAVFILLGRLLCMVWTISAAVSVSRRMSKSRSR